VLAIRVKQVFDGRRVVAGAGVVFVDDGRIVGIEPATADIPHGCRVLDQPTATVLPGLIDAHVHLLAIRGREPWTGWPTTRPTTATGSSSKPFR